MPNIAADIADVNIRSHTFRFDKVGDRLAAELVGGFALADAVGRQIRWKALRISRVE